MSYNGWGLPQKSPQEVQAEYNALMSQFQNMYTQNSQANNQQAKSPAVSEKGQFVKVSSFDEVSDYPTPLDGMATLFFDFKNRVFWSKKFTNGGHSVQAFKFEPINNAEPTKDEVDYTKEIEDIPDPLNDRMDKLEKMLEKLLIQKQKPKKEEVKDEI